jgi:DNA-binding NarL/FixJ family response regulator
MRVVLAEDSVLLRDGLSRLFASRDCPVVAAVGDADALLQAVDEHRPDRLTPREHDVLALMAESRSNAGVAGALVVSESAVAKHVNSIFAKLGLPPADSDHRRVLAVLRFLGG